MKTRGNPSGPEASKTSLTGRIYGSNCVDWPLLLNRKSLQNGGVHLWADDRRRINGLLTSIKIKFAWIPPSIRIDARSYKLTKTRIGPVRHVTYPAMLNRIPMDIIGMTIKIILIYYQMRPKTTLPNTSFTPFCPAFWNSFACIDVSGKMSFYLSPTGWIITIARWKSQQTRLPA